MTDSTFLQDGEVQADGIRQHYLRYGGPAGYRAHRNTVILVPGGTSPAESWGFVGERFGRHFDTYVLDLKLSDAVPALGQDLDAQAAHLNAFAAALGLEHWAAVGHGLGARIALRAAMAQPPGLGRLSLIDPPGLHTADIDADLPNLQVPVLLVTAERGGVVSEDDVFEMEIAMPGLHEVRVPNAGHMIPWDNEEGFYEAFGDFLGATLDP